VGGRRRARRVLRGDAPGAERDCLPGASARGRRQRPLPGPGPAAGGLRGRAVGVFPGVPERAEAEVFREEDEVVPIRTGAQWAPLSRTSFQDPGQGRNMSVIGRSGRSWQQACCQSKIQSNSPGSLQPASPACTTSTRRSSFRPPGSSFRASRLHVIDGEGSVTPGKTCMLDQRSNLASKRPQIPSYSTLSGRRRASVITRRIHPHRTRSNRSDAGARGGDAERLAGNSANYPSAVPPPTNPHSSTTSHGVGVG
jgi:hypothetical protein